MGFREEGLSLIGEKPKLIVCRYLEVKFSIKGGKVGYRIRESESIVDETFGVGAEIIKREITKAHFSDLGPVYREDVRHSLTGCVRYALKILDMSPSALY